MSTNVPNAPKITRSPHLMRVLWRSTGWLYPGSPYLNVNLRLRLPSIRESSERHP